MPASLFLGPCHSHRCFSAALHLEPILRDDRHLLVHHRLLPATRTGRPDGSLQRHQAKTNRQTFPNKLLDPKEDKACKTSGLLTPNNLKEQRPLHP